MGFLVRRFQPITRPKKYNPSEGGELGWCEGQACLMESEDDELVAAAEAAETQAGEKKRKAFAKNEADRAQRGLKEGLASQAAHATAREESYRAEIHSVRTTLFAQMKAAQEVSKILGSDPPTAAHTGQANEVDAEAATQNQTGDTARRSRRLNGEAATEAAAEPTARRKRRGEASGGEAEAGGSGKRARGHGPTQTGPCSPKRAAADRHGTETPGSGGAGGDTAVRAVGKWLESDGEEEGGRGRSCGEHERGGGIGWVNEAGPGEAEGARDSRCETTTATVMRYTADECTPPAHVHEERVME